MRLWLDAQLPPLLAGWINTQGLVIQAVMDHLRDGEP
jgi:predicted nuclease of predicted toxin-antitoxin system